MVRLIVAVLVAFVAWSAHAEVIVIDDNANHEFRDNDLGPDDVLRVLSGHARLFGQTIASAEVMQTGRITLLEDSFADTVSVESSGTGPGGTAEVRVDGSTVNQIIVDLEFDGEERWSAEVNVRRGADVGTIDLTGTIYMSIEGATIGAINAETARRVYLSISGHLLDVNGDWHSDTARLAGITTFGNSLPFSLDLPLSNRADWNIRLFCQAGVMRGEMCGIPPRVVGIDDLNAVRNAFGVIGEVPGDVSYDGVVSIDDLNVVRNHFGESSTRLWSAQRAVPEPSTLLLLLTTLFALSMPRCRFPR